MATIHIAFPYFINKKKSNMAFFTLCYSFFTQWECPIEKKTINLHKTKCLLILNYKNYAKKFTIGRIVRIRTIRHSTDIRQKAYSY